MSEQAEKFSLVIGGPFHRVLGACGLLGPDQLPTLRAALLIAMLAWFPGALLAVGSYMATRNPETLTYFIDHTVYIRSLFAIAVIVYFERTSEQRLAPIVRQFRFAGLVDAGSESGYREELRRADERTASTIAEAIILLVVAVIAVTTVRLDVEFGGYDWDGWVVDGRPEYSWAGLWNHWIARPLFQFLLLRWLWRFAVWAWLLWRISRLRLQLVAYHPDQAGGLGFLSVFPTVFTGLIFAISCVAASQWVSELQQTSISIDQVKILIGAWVALILLIFVGPLLAFIPPLYRLRDRAIFELGQMASEHQQAFEAKWVRSGNRGTELLGSVDVSSGSDLMPIAASPYSLRIIPVYRHVFVQLFAAAGLPMLAVMATQVPLAELVGRMASAVL